MTTRLEKTPNNSGRYVRGVVKVGVVRQLVDLDPFQRLARGPRFTDRRKTPAFRFYQRVAAHTGLRRWNHRVRRFLDVGVAIAAVHTHLARVQLVAVRDRLSWRVADLEVLRRHVVPDASDHGRTEEAQHSGGDQRELVQRAREELHRCVRRVMGLYQDAVRPFVAAPL